MNLRFTTVVLIAYVSTGVCGNAARANNSTDDKLPQRVTLTVYPAAQSRPALKYALLHDVIDQKRGNAALAYAQVMQQLKDEAFKTDSSVFRNEWLRTPLADLPVAEMAGVLERYDHIIKQLERASLCEQCDWQTNLREDGIDTQLPHLGPVRNLARLLAVHTRYEIASGQSEQAIRHLRVGFAMGQHVGAGETLIEGLVGLAINAIMLGGVLELAQQPDAPNLYWPLTDLPDPFLDVQRSIQGEKWWLYATFPALLEARKGEFSARQWHDMCSEMGRKLDLIAGSPGAGLRGSLTQAGRPLIGTALAVYAYPRAKQYLIRHGDSAEKVEAMSVAEVLVTTLLDGYESQRDNLFKWYAVPSFPQARVGLERFEEQLASTDGWELDMFLARTLLPALSRARFTFAKLDRNIALGCCVEMIRLHAAADEGKLPASLADVEDAAVPIDPITGKPFSYRVEDDKAIIDAPAPAGHQPRHGFIYEITVANNK